MVPQKAKQICCADSQSWFQKVKLTTKDQSVQIENYEVINKTKGPATITENANTTVNKQRNEFLKFTANRRCNVDLIDASAGSEFGMIYNTHSLQIEF